MKARFLHREEYRIISRDVQTITRTSVVYHQIHSLRKIKQDGPTEYGYWQPEMGNENFKRLYQEFFKRHYSEQQTHSLYEKLGLNEKYLTDYNEFIKNKTNIGPSEKYSLKQDFCAEQIMNLFSTHHKRLLKYNKDADAFCNDAIHSEIFFKEQLIYMLDEYINKIGGNQTDFKKGFCFFATSQGINRQANYELAKKLKEELTRQESSVKNVFSNLIERRNQVGADIPGFKKNGGIHSDTLNVVIGVAKAYTKSIKVEENKAGLPLLMP